MSSPLETLREKNKVLLELYRDHLQGIKQLQEQLLDEKVNGKTLYGDPWVLDTGWFHYATVLIELKICYRVALPTFESKHKF